MNVIQKIHIKNFESYDDTTLDGFSPGLNAIVGASNSGKSSIVRALKLVWYNDFDPRSIRKGCEDCEVEVFTSNGNVKVIRGKHNIWEVTDRTGKKSVFDRIGKQLLPQVTDILGFGLVKLGDMEMQANIMDQLESHFMLAEFSGQDATGSLRAQVVDEISGLSGIETLIRDVSLDNSRTTRAINQLEERNHEIETQLHDTNVLKKEEAVLLRAGNFLGKYDDDLENISVLTELKDEHKRESGILDGINRDIAGFPDEAKALMCITSAENFAKDLSSMMAMQMATDALQVRLEDIGTELKGIPDEVSAQGLMQKADKDSTKLAGVQVLFKDWWNENDIVEALVQQQYKLPDSKIALSFVDKAEAKLKKLEAAFQMLEACQDVEDELGQISLDMANAVGEEKEAAEEYNRLLAGFDVCPITTKPITGDCLKGVRIPIPNDKDAT